MWVFFSHPQTFESHKTCVGEANEGFWGLRKWSVSSTSTQVPLTEPARCVLFMRGSIRRFVSQSIGLAVTLSWRSMKIKARSNHAIHVNVHSFHHEHALWTLWALFNNQSKKPGRSYLGTQLGVAAPLTAIDKGPQDLMWRQLFSWIAFSTPKTCH